MLKPREVKVSLNRFANVDQQFLSYFFVATQQVEPINIHRNVFPRYSCSNMKDALVVLAILVSVVFADHNTGVRVSLGIDGCLDQQLSDEFRAEIFFLFQQIVAEADPRQGHSWSPVTSCESLCAGMPRSSCIAWLVIQSDLFSLSLYLFFQQSTMFADLAQVERGNGA